jgi:hypothetical protein
MNKLIFDIEGDSLTPTRIWCLAANTAAGVKSTTNVEKMKRELTSADILIGHNIARFDIPTLERLLNIKIKGKIVDTLALSWYLFPNRIRHGLESWGEDLGVKKPPIIRWDDPEMIDEYCHRCREDVKINTKLWKLMWKKLMSLYKSEEKAWELIDYLSFKMDCAREQERSKWKLDVELCTASLKELSDKKTGVVDQLIEAMPQVPVLRKKKRPAKPFMKSGQMSVSGLSWKQALKDLEIPNDPETFDKDPDEVSIITGYVKGKPSSSQQVKEWLYSCGWKPETFKYVRGEDGDVRAIPQVNAEHGAGICPSVKKLFEKHPEFELLDGLGVVSHRISILEGFLDNLDKNGYIAAQVAGLTNTLRFKHKTLVNLPKIGKAYADSIRASLIAGDGEILCGSDMSSLEDRLKQHFIYPYDPDYVNEMSSDTYDPHLSLAVLAKSITLLQMDTYIHVAGLNAEEKAKANPDILKVAKSVKPIRDIFKNGNYACQYGAGPPRLALTSNITLKEAKKVHKAYWEKNWAIVKVSESQKIIQLDGEMWLVNPINGFLYSLRAEKDIFSTLVQGSAVYVFDLWIMTFRKARSQLTAQFHDEVVLTIKEGQEKRCEKLLRDSISQVNEQLKLNRELGIDVQFGTRYSDIH